MLPLIGGLAIGLGVGQRLQSPRSRPDGGPASRPPWWACGRSRQPGSPSWRAALALGTATSAASSAGFVSAWFAVTGLGLGMAMPTMLNAALSALVPSTAGRDRH